MRLGVDTGFFIAYARGHPRALEFWEEVEEGVHTLVVSTVTLNELLVYFYRRGSGSTAEKWINDMVAAPEIEIIPVSVEIAVRSAGYRHGLGLPTIDSIILSTFVWANCDLIVTTDKDFEIVHQQRVLPVEFILY